MRRSVMTFLAAASAVVATPAVAGKSNIQTLPEITHPCDLGLKTGSGGGYQNRDVKIRAGPA